MIMSGLTYAHCNGWADCATRPAMVECPPRLTYPPPAPPTHILFIGWRGPATDFRKDLLERRCYFVHGAKCWRTPEAPSFEAIRRCSPLLAQDIARLKPVNLCILGTYAHIAAALVAHRHLKRPPGCTEGVLLALLGEGRFALLGGVEGGFLVPLPVGTRGVDAEGTSCSFGVSGLDIHNRRRQKTPSRPRCRRSRRIERDEKNNGSLHRA